MTLDCETVVFIVSFIRQDKKPFKMTNIETKNNTNYQGIKLQIINQVIKRHMFDKIKWKNWKQELKQPNITAKHNKLLTMEIQVFNDKQTNSILNICILFTMISKFSTIRIVNNTSVYAKKVQYIKNIPNTVR